MTGWIIIGGLVLALLALGYAGAGRDRHKRNDDLDLIDHRATGSRNDASGTTFHL